jgi:hypothetical protein
VKSKNPEGKGAPTSPPPVAPVRRDPPPVALPEPVEAVLQQVPAPQREKVRETFAALLQYHGPVPNPIFDKLTPAHVDKLIDGAAKDNERMYEDKRDGRKLEKFFVVIGVAAFLAISGLFLWAKQTGLLEKVIQIAVIYAGGVGTGVGLVKRRSQ